MKNKKKKIIAVLVTICLLFSSTGCTKTMVDKNKKTITNPETGQSLTANILCKPEDKKLYDIYKKNEKSMTVKLEDLPSCKEFSPGKVKYESIWTSVFIKPLAYLILKLGELVKYYGISVMIIGLLIRLIMVPFTNKTMAQSENMKKVQPALKRIEKKYEGKTDNESMMAKSQEMMMIYKKYNISPVSGCLMSFIQLPLFFAFLEAINRIPAIFEETFPIFNLQLGTTPLKGISSGNYYYIILIALIILTTYLSFKFSMGNSNDETQAQMQMMTKFMLIFISIASLSLPAAIGLYWIVTNAFAAIQSLINQKKMNNKHNNKEKKVKTTRLKESK